MKREFLHAAASVRGATCLCHHWDPSSLTSMVSAHDPAQPSLGAIKDLCGSTSAENLLITCLVVCYGPERHIGLRDNFSYNKPAVLLRILPWSGK